MFVEGLSLRDAVEMVGRAVEPRGFDRHPPWLFKVEADEVPGESGGVACSWIRFRYDARSDQPSHGADYASVLHDGRFSLHLAGERFWYAWGPFDRLSLLKEVRGVVARYDAAYPPNDRAPRNI